jgi:hypothetical protein
MTDDGELPMLTAQFGLDQGACLREHKILFGSGSLRWHGARLLRR